MALRLRRMNNFDGSYETLDGKYEIVNFSKQDSTCDNEWTIIQWQPHRENIDTLPTLKDCREALEMMITEGTY